MFNKIMVPLDGSRLAECALIYAETLARNCGPSEIVLVRVTEKTRGITDSQEAQEVFMMTDDTGLKQEGDNILVTFGKMEKQAGNYLEKIENELNGKGIRVSSKILVGNPAKEITDLAKEEGFDIIVMSSHGRSGPSRWALGSVSDKVFRASCIPVLMVRAPGCIPGF